MSRKTVKKCLDAIEISSKDLEVCEDLDEEFSKIKKAYFKKILASHPDKGGDADIFREVQTSFEVIREIYQLGKIASFVTAAAEPTKRYEYVYEEFAATPTPSWEYYYEAAAETVPGYRFELAKTGRGICKQKGLTAKKCTDEPPFINKGELRVGTMDLESGSYSRWSHLPCWRVPSKVWLGLPKDTKDPAEFRRALNSMDGVVLSGLHELPTKDLAKVVRHTMDEGNWARLTKASLPSAGDGAGNGSVATTADDSSSSSSSQALTIKKEVPKQHFIIPVPGKRGAKRHALDGKRVVLTGVFPEVGGGAGLRRGKDRVKAMVESFGGRVTSRISGLTDILLVGKEPGYSAVTKARTSPRITMMTLEDLTEGLTKGRVTEGNGGAIIPVKPVVIPKFSAGYRGNTLALEASADEVAVADGSLQVKTAKKLSKKDKLAIQAAAEAAATAAAEVSKSLKKGKKALMLEQVESKNGNGEAHANKRRKGVKRGSEQMISLVEESPRKRKVV